MQEPLLMSDENRYSFLPIPSGREPILQSYRNQQASFWMAHQVDMSEDKKDWDNGLIYPNTKDSEQIKINEAAKEFVLYILAFFSSSDLLVIQNLDENFINEMQWLEIKLVYNFQASMEYIHSEAYALQIDTLESNIENKNKLFNAVKEMPCVAKKADWVYKYMNRDKTFATRLIAFSCVEGILFSGEFCAIFWLKSINKMPGLTRYNDLISKDEGMHTDFACLLYTKYIANKLTEKEVHEIISSAVDIECEFILDAISCSMIGMNRRDMKNYIQFVANRLSLQLGYSEIYPKIENPFSFMHKISLECKQNFFEGRPTQYNVATVTDPKKNIYNDCADF